MDLVCIRHFSLSAVLCLILAHQDHANPSKKPTATVLSLKHTHTHALSCSKVTVTVSKYGQRDGRVVTFLKSVFVQLYEACIPHGNHNVLGGAGERCRNVV